MASHAQASTPRRLHVHCILPQNTSPVAKHARICQETVGKLSRCLRHSMRFRGVILQVCDGLAHVAQACRLAGERHEVLVWLKAYVIPLPILGVFNKNSRSRPENLLQSVAVGLTPRVDKVLPVGVLRHGYKRRLWRLSRLPCDFSSAATQPCEVHLHASVCLTLSPHIVTRAIVTWPIGGALHLTPPEREFDPLLPGDTTTDSSLFDSKLFDSSLVHQKVRTRDGNIPHFTSRGNAENW